MAHIPHMPSPSPAAPALSACKLRGLHASARTRPTPTGISLPKNSPGDMFNDWTGRGLGAGPKPCGSWVLG